MTRLNSNIPTLDPSQVTAFHAKSMGWFPNYVSNNKHRFFHINQLKDVNNKEDFTLPPHRKTFFDFIYITKGSTIRTKGLNAYEFGAGNIFFLPPHQITEHTKMSPDLEGYFCHFNQAIFEHLPSNYLSENYAFFKLQANPLVHLPKEKQAIVEHILSRMTTVYNEDSPSTNKKLFSAYLISLFEEVKMHYQTDNYNSNKSCFEITERYKYLLSKNIYKFQDVASFADLLHISPNYLNKCVKKSTNKTSHDLLHEMLILEAKTLIKYSNFQIHEIANKLCNQSPSNFARFFKKHTGMTPKEYASKAN
ncbi:MAG: AraC family transcriptional regulator [Crocinitomicaceae bacterium]|nr:AraC family transcriptional regulator [Crocinitomicaceae bacterium]|tara:strand:+ start:1794 stop:2714 length:921 start_codon:yes stop_codon:yes gene_type:complete